MKEQLMRKLGGFIDDDDYYKVLEVLSYDMIPIEMANELELASKIKNDEYLSEDSKEYILGSLAAFIGFVRKW